MEEQPEEIFAFMVLQKTDYWTNDARQLFIDCVGAVLSECEQDSDCGDESYSDNYCFAGDVVRNHTLPICENGKCSEEVVKEVVETCSDFCVDGECVEPECENDGECGDEQLVNYFCKNDDKWGKYSVPECLNAGELDSSCTSKFEERFEEECALGCENGECVEEQVTCYDDEDCGIDGFIDGLFCNGRKIKMSGRITETIHVIIKELFQARAA